MSKLTGNQEFNGDVYVKSVGTYTGSNPVSGTNDLATVIGGKQDAFPKIYIGSSTDLTADQKAHNTAVLTALVAEDNTYGMLKNRIVIADIVLLGETCVNQYLYLVGCMSANNLFRLTFKLDSYLFNYQAGIYTTTVTNGVIDISLFEPTMVFDLGYKIRFLALSPNPGVEYTTSITAGSSSNFPTVEDAADAGTYSFLIDEKEKSYNYKLVFDAMAASTDNYYQFYYDIDDKTVRVRVYGDTSITTMWYPFEPAAVADKVFVAKYNVTTFAEIAAAVAAGKVVVCTPNTGSGVGTVTPMTAFYNDPGVETYVIFSGYNEDADTLYYYCLIKSPYSPYTETWSSRNSVNLTDIMLENNYPIVTQAQIDALFQESGPSPTSS